MSLSTEIVPTDKEDVAFKDLDAAILVGSMPRKEGMERKDLLKANVAIFKTQGAALDKYAKKTVKVTRRSSASLYLMSFYLLIVRNHCVLKGYRTLFVLLKHREMKVLIHLLSPDETLSFNCFPAAALCFCSNLEKEPHILNC